MSVKVLRTSRNNNQGAEWKRGVSQYSAASDSVIYSASHYSSASVFDLKKTQQQLVSEHHFFQPKIKLTGNMQEVG